MDEIARLNDVIKAQTALLSYRADRIAELERTLDLKASPVIVQVHGALTEIDLERIRAAVKTAALTQPSA